MLISIVAIVIVVGVVGYYFDRDSTLTSPDASSLGEGSGSRGCMCPEIDLLGKSRSVSVTIIEPCGLPSSSQTCRDLPTCKVEVRADSLDNLKRFVIGLGAGGWSQYGTYWGCGTWFFGWSNSCTKVEAPCEDIFYD